MRIWRFLSVLTLSMLLWGLCLSAGCTMLSREDNLRIISAPYGLIAAPFVYTFVGGAYVATEAAKESEQGELEENYDIWAKARRELDAREAAGLSDEAPPPIELE